MNSRGPGISPGPRFFVAVSGSVDDDQTGFTQVWLSPVSGVVQPRPLTMAPWDHYNPQWAPDGRCVVFEADLPEYTQIHVVAIDRPFQEHPVTAEPLDHFWPRPFPARTAVRQPGGVQPTASWDMVYERDDDDGFTQIGWSQRCERCLGGEPAVENQLTFREVDHTCPCPPNDSGDVLYQAEDDEYGMEGIWRVRLSDPGVEWLVMFDDTCDFGHPDLSPDGGTAAADRDGYDGSIAVYGEDIYGRMSGSLTPADAVRSWPRFSVSPNSQSPALAVAWEAMAGGGGVQSAGRLPGTGYGFRQASASPALGNVTLSWQLPCGQHVRVAVYDMLGRLVRTVQDGESPAGTGRAVWDRKDERGRRVSAGIYFCELGRKSLNLWGTELVRILGSAGALSAVVRSGQAVVAAQDR